MARNITRVHISVKHTSSTDLVDGSQQFADALMRVDTFGHTFEAVSEDELDDGAVDIGRVKHTGKRVAALMRRMRHAEVVHDRVKDSAAERVVAVTAAICASADVESGSLHSLLVPWHELARDGDKPARTGIGLAVPDHDDATAQLDVSLPDMTVLTDTASRVYEHEDMTCFGHIINATPQAVALTDGKRLFLVQFTRSVNIEISGIIFDDQVISYCVLVKLLEQRADFLLRWVSAACMTHIVNDMVEVAEPDVHENHLMEAGAMTIRIFVADARRITSEAREVLGLPKRVDLGKSCLARTQQGRVAIILDETGHGLLECFKIADRLLFPLYCLLCHVRTATIPLHFVDRAESIW
nr:MAG TPA: hypothetical protein [Caudoviricetes sp.]